MESYVDALSVAKKWSWIASERARRVQLESAVQDLQSLVAYLGELLDEAMIAGRPRRTEPRWPLRGDHLPPRFAAGPDHKLDDAEVDRLAREVLGLDSDAR